MADTAPEALVRHAGALVVAALVALTLLAWLALLAGAGTDMDPAAMSFWLVPTALLPALSSPWTPAYWLIAFFMWAVMMVAMMLPSAAPMVLLYARVVRRAENQGRPMRAPASIAAFASGYLTLWIHFSVLAVALQVGLEREGAMTAMMSSRRSGRPRPRRWRRCWSPAVLRCSSWARHEPSRQEPGGFCQYDGASANRTR
jgi:predicted metal-binding membrane protein